MDLEVVWKARSQIGEGPIWWEDRLYWIDIPEKLLHVYIPKTDTKKTWTVPYQIGTVVPRKSGGLVLATEGGIFLFNTETEKLVPLPNPPVETIAGRFNDGKCDPSGRLWVGTMAEENGKGIGHLYRLDPDFQASVHVDEIGCSNGICWSLDKTKMYYIDSTPNTLSVFDYDNASGSVSNRQIILTYPKGDNKPILDGMTIDSKGNLWIGLWQGGAVICLDPNTGEELDRIKVPANKITCCAFGGSDLKDLYITTVSAWETDEQLEKKPLSGSLFRCRPGAKGIQAFPFAG